MRSLPAKILSSLLCAALLLAAPGPSCYQALAAGVESQSANAGKSGVPASALPAGVESNSSRLQIQGLTDLAGPGQAPPPAPLPIAPALGEKIASPPALAPRTSAPTAGAPATVHSTQSRETREEGHAGNASVFGGLSQAERQTRDAYFADPSGAETAEVLRQFYAGEKLRDSNAAPAREVSSDLSGNSLLPAAQALARTESPGLPSPAPIPRSSLARSFKIGFTVAAICLIIHSVIVATAALSGYEFHSNYIAPDSDRNDGLSPAQALASFIALAIMAPVAEEPLFRGGLMGTLTWLGSRIKRWNILTFWLPALISSAIFVAAHETADLVLIGSRTIISLIFSRVYHKEGLIASITTHGFFNALIFMMSLFSSLSPLGLAAGLTLAATALVWSSLGLKRQKTQVKAGLIVPYELTPSRLLALLLVLGAGNFAFLFLFSSINLVWLWGGVLLLGYGLKKWNTQQQDLPAPERRA